MPPCAPCPLCRQVDTAGHRCGSPALRGKPVCFYHDTARQPLTVKQELGRVLPNLPAPIDLQAIQIGYSQLLRLIAEDQIDRRDATLLLRTLSGASANLARIHRRELTHPAVPVTDLVLDPTYGPLAPETAAPEPLGMPLPAVQELAPPQGNQYFTDFQQSHARPTPAEAPAPTPTLRQPPALPPAPDPGPLTLAEQYVATDRDHSLSPTEQRDALAALTARLLQPSPEDRDRDRQILAARTQHQPFQYFTEIEEDHPVLTHAA